MESEKSRVSQWREQLGPPDIELAQLQIWIHTRQFPDHDDYWDGNWLDVSVHCGGAGADVWASGSIIHLSELIRWHASVVLLQKDLNGEARLDCMEPNLEVILKAERLGHINMEVSLTPDHMSQRHWFQFELDQTYLSPLIAQCESVFEKYPSRGER